MQNKSLITLFKALANEHRLEIIKMLLNKEHYFPDAHPEYKHYGICLGAIAKKMALAQSTISSYMSQLEAAELVESKRFGQWTIYRINSSNQQILGFLKSYFDMA